MIISTLVYIEKDDHYLMLLRNKKEKDVNSGKWIGVGGKLEKGESPEECAIREAYEETGLMLQEIKFRGILTFSSEGWEDELIFVYTSDAFDGNLKECNEGELRWIQKDKINDLNLWQGDRVFLKLLIESDMIFSIKLSYKGDELIEQKIIEYK